MSNGGYIAFQQQGAAVTGVNAVFNTGAQWTAATANVSIPNDSGNFSIFIANSQVQVIVDVNGYYQDMDFVDVGTQELDISGDMCSSCNLFELTNTGAGSALALNSSSGTAIQINSGGLRSVGAGVGTNTTSGCRDAAEVADVVAYNVYRQFREHGNEWDQPSAAQVSIYPWLGRILPRFVVGPANQLEGWGIVKWPSDRKSRWVVNFHDADGS